MRQSSQTEPGPDFPETQYLLTDVLKPVEKPCLIVSSLAGLGNYRAAEAVRENMPPGRVYHHALDEFVSERLRHQCIDRYRFLCMYAPPLLRFLYAFSPGYLYRYHAERLFQWENLDSVASKLDEINPAAVIASNHRAAFWISALKRRGRISCRLIGLLTDFALSPGWLKLFTEEVDELWGPVDKDRIPFAYARKYKKIPFPVCSDVLKAKNSNPERNKVLISGGGWGLGPIRRTLAMLAPLSGLELHVATGTNGKLYKRLKSEKRKNVMVHGGKDSMALLMERCAGMITKPGAVTLAEAAALRRKIFLLPGLPVIEEANAAYAREFFGAEDFSFRAFESWLQGTEQR